MADPIVVDANVIVALLYEQDALHADAVAAVGRAQAAARPLELLDLLVYEALSVLGRRASERKTSPPNYSSAIAAARAWFDTGAVRSVADQLTARAPEVLATMEGNPRLSANDALMLVLQRTGGIGDVLTFDRELSSTTGFRSFA